jgi:Flagellar biosynthesis protein, FliO
MPDWMKSIFGETLPQPLSYVALFAAVIVGIVLLLWIAKKLLGGTFVSGGRGRHLRLAVMDATPVDSRRRLVLVRRDDVEHLILIGGPTDVVVEQNIRLDGQRDTKPVAAPSTVAEPEPPRAVDALRAREPAQPALQQPELRQRPLTTPPAPYLPPRPVLAPPPPPTTRYAGASMPTPNPVQPQPVQRPVFPPIVQTPPAQMPTAAPVLAGMAAAAVAVPEVLSVAPARQAETLRPTDNDIDEGLLADLTESMGFVDDAAPEISLEKEMESLLGTLDPKNDRIS